MVLACGLLMLTTGTMAQQTVPSEETGGGETEQIVNPSEMGPDLEQAKEADNEQRNLQELLAVPFNQLKADKKQELDREGEDQDEVSEEGNLPLPAPQQQSRSEKLLQEKLDSMLKEMLPDVFVGVTVSIKYFIETVPVTKNKKKISKIKLPGFENHVWVPTKTREIIGIVNQTRTYTTVFVLVNAPISLFNVEVLRQSVSEQLEEINFLKDDVLKVVYVPHASSTDTTVATMDPAVPAPESEEPADFIEPEEKPMPETKAEEIAEEPHSLQPEEIQQADEERLEELPLQIEELSMEATAEQKPKQKSPEDIDMAMKMETTRFLLRAREAYLQNDFDSAITAISDAIEVNPYSPQAYEMLGSIYYRLGWNGMALENWQRALKLDPANELLKKYLSRLARQ